MLVLLPPSETKRDGGAGGPLELGRLGFASLTAARRRVLTALTELAGDADAMARALRLRGTRDRDIARNRRLMSAPTMPAIDRYTGVLFDALAAHELDDAARGFVSRSVVIHSALFGLLRADDRIPPYRLSHDSRLPGLTMKKAWAEPIGAALDESAEFVLDLRSEGYAALGPAPARSAFVRVITRDENGRTRALNHFNKKAKGLFVASLAEAKIDHHSVGSLIDWAGVAGWELEPGAPGELELVVPPEL